jgi:hypothetical protein
MSIRIARLVVMFFLITSIASAEDVYKAAGPNPGSIAPVVSLFSQARFTCVDLDWDNFPIIGDAQAAPFNLPNPYDVPLSTFVSLRFSTPGSGFQISAAEGNPTATPVRFGNINPIYPEIFQTFSPQRLFTPLGNNNVVITFSPPVLGLDTNGAAGFGAVFTNVTKENSTWLEFIDDQGKRHGPYFVPSTEVEGGLSFLGVVPRSRLITEVRMHVGNAPLDSRPPANNPDSKGSSGPDLVAIDDLILQCRPCPAVTSGIGILCGEVNGDW